MMLSCESCGCEFSSEGRRGRSPKFCSSRCRQRAYRVRRDRRDRFMSLAEGRWVRARGKVPLTVDGGAASSTNPATWSSHARVVSSAVGDGLGVMLGGGLACLDLDDCFDGSRLEPWALDALSGIPEPLFVERSVSGRGLHVFFESPEVRGVKRGGAERYSRERFIRVTFDEFE